MYFLDVVVQGWKQSVRSAMMLPNSSVTPTEWELSVGKLVELVLQLRGGQFRNWEFVLNSAPNGGMTENRGKLLWPEVQEALSLVNGTSKPTAGALVSPILYALNFEQSSFVATALPPTPSVYGFPSCPAGQSRTIHTAVTLLQWLARSCWTIAFFPILLRSWGSASARDLYPWLAVMQSPRVTLPTRTLLWGLLALLSSMSVVRCSGCLFVLFSGCFFCFRLGCGFWCCARLEPKNRLH